ncbi:HPr family phosphocarrier protein [[Clostridium] fimetarium]|uniref:Phosphocarrier protein n=1 Tax=[Clostridium] fimetarium TaxID=99656 RepID=A0A1I0RFR3_9FIRM|nr:HPr family phosphocarrier protein [[Clostridium] fimetarium]SEW39522.1 phosphocarrier protein [[Clostridium] fimetarium]
MKSFNYTIQDEIGIHARPAGLLVKAAKPFTSTITLKVNDQQSDAKKLMALMALGVGHGAEITITAEGDDEDAAITKLEEFFKENL